MQLDNPLEQSDVVIVDITAADFEDLFDGKTQPLNPPKLQELITAVSKGKPCVIGIDIGTDFPQFADPGQFVVKKDWSPIVWVRDIKSLPEDVTEKPVAVGILGKKDAGGLNSGLPLLIDDRQGVTRKYRRLIETETEKLPSFGWAIYRQAAREKCKGMKFPPGMEIDQREEEESALYISFSRGNTNSFGPDTDQDSVKKDGGEEWTEAEYIGRTKIPASQITDFADGEDWQNNELIKDKIVLIGGSYNEDSSQTPLGRLWGVEIIANVIETELNGGGLKPPGFLVTSLFAAFDGLLLLLLFHVFSWQRAFLIGLVSIVILSFICSLIAFGTFSYWILYTPIMLGVLLTELYDRLKGYLKGKYRGGVEDIYEKAVNKKTKDDEAADDSNDQ
jgi:hypothetical protein